MRDIFIAGNDEIERVAVQNVLAQRALLRRFLQVLQIFFVDAPACLLRARKQFREVFRIILTAADCVDRGFCPVDFGFTS